MGEKVFFQSENHFLNICADILVSFPVILLFWSLSLSPVWLNIEGRQDFRYKTPIIFFYSENNSDSLNCPPNTNLPIVQCLNTGLRRILTTFWRCSLIRTRWNEAMHFAEVSKEKTKGRFFDQSAQYMTRQWEEQSKLSKIGLEVTSIWDYTLEMESLSHIRFHEGQPNKMWK